MPPVPVSVCEQFNCMHVVSIFLRRDGVMHPAPTRTVASVLMGASRESILPTPIIAPAEGTLRGDQKLYDDIIGKCGIQWSTLNINTVNKKFWINQILS